MKQIRAHNVGLVFAAFGGGGYALWMLTVALGAGQSVLDFVFRLHMISPPWRVAAFDLGTAISLVMLMTISWYAFGWVLGLLWDRFVAAVHHEVFHPEKTRG